MKDYIVKHEWKIIEDQYDPETNQITESLLSLGNGKMGQRANFEEHYSGETLQGNYIAGVYYPDKTRVGWWKNGYPEYFAKVLNSCNWIGINIEIGGVQLDLAKATIIHTYHRELDMKRGLLTRQMDITLSNGARLEIESRRFISMAHDEIGAIDYSIKAIDYEGKITLSPYLDFDVRNMDSNYDENFWLPNGQISNEQLCYVEAITKKTNYSVGVSMENKLSINGISSLVEPTYQTATSKALVTYELSVNSGDTINLQKIVAVASSMYHQANLIQDHTISSSKEASKTGFEVLLNAHKQAWEKIWDMCDIQIEGDVSAQQGIRFNIFQLYQTYTGHDDRLNIGPKGFTGEKYGGSTYWDTEAYCIPFYLSTSDESVARNLLIYRYKQLDKAIENAEKLGFTCGAALYPMVTMTGEECHNEWEITFEEIHRNGAIAYAIFDYIRYTEDKAYLIDYGLEVLVAIARFWAQRVHWSAKRSQYVMLGVTGPNEYENNVNNNWYTNYIACWCLEYAQEAITYVSTTDPTNYEALVQKMSFAEGEQRKWQHIIDNMYYPSDEELGIFLQQDNYLDKEQILVDDLADKYRPINQKWSWDRILRSCFIKQADVLQGLYFFEEKFDDDVLRRNYEFYEPRTVHESSLSPCVHGILASSLSMDDKAYEMYLRTARLDLDDYNNDTEDGCHITSMAGTWLAIVKGFGGQRVSDGYLCFSPRLPQQWQSLSFKMKFRSNLLQVNMTTNATKILNLAGPAIKVKMNTQDVLLTET